MDAPTEIKAPAESSKAKTENTACPNCSGKLARSAEVAHDVTEVDGEEIAVTVTPTGDVLVCTDCLQASPKYVDK